MTQELFLKGFILSITFFVVGAHARQLPAEHEGDEQTHVQAPNKVVLKPGDKRTETFNGTVEMSCESDSQPDKYLCSVYCQCQTDTLYDMRKTPWVTGTGATREEAFKKVDCQAPCEREIQAVNQHYPRKLKLMFARAYTTGDSGPGIEATPINACALNR